MTKLQLKQALEALTNFSDDTEVKFSPDIQFGLPSPTYYKIDDLIFTRVGGGDIFLVLC